LHETQSIRLFVRSFSKVSCLFLLNYLPPSPSSDNQRIHCFSASRLRQKGSNVHLQPSHSYIRPLSDIAWTVLPIYLTGTHSRTYPIDVRQFMGIAPIQLTGADSNTRHQYAHAQANWLLSWRLTWARLEHHRYRRSSSSRKGGRRRVIVGVSWSRMSQWVVRGRYAAIISSSEARNRFLLSSADVIANGRGWDSWMLSQNSRGRESEIMRVHC